MDFYDVSCAQILFLVVKSDGPNLSLICYIYCWKHLRHIKDIYKEALNSKPALIFQLQNKEIKWNMISQVSSIFGGGKWLLSHISPLIPKQQSMTSTVAK